MLSAGVRAVIGRALSGMYLPAVLHTYAQSTVRDSTTGLFPKTLTGTHLIRLQPESFSETQKRSDGYTTDDRRFLVLQSGVSATVDTNSTITFEGVVYRVLAPVEQDPARVYWDLWTRKVS